MKHKVSELEGRALDAAVAKAEGYVPQFHPAGLGAFYRLGEPDAIPSDHYCASTNWQHGGPIIQRERIAVAPFKDGWCALMPESEAVDMGRYDAWSYIDVSMPEDANGIGEMPLTAAMRAYVASKFGEEIELLGEFENKGQG